MTAKPKQQTTRGPGRPRCGVYRLECTLPQPVLDELKRQEQATGVYRTRIAAGILERALVGGKVNSFVNRR
jgi:hypothetical protein